MSETQAAMREYRFLDDKRKTGGLSSDEEQRWQYLGVSLGIVVPPEPAPGEWGTDGLWYAAPLPPEQQGPGVWDPGALGLGYDAASGAYWDPAAQNWYQGESGASGEQAPGPDALAAMPMPSGQSNWSAPALPADKSVGGKAPWRSVSEPAPMPEPAAAEPVVDEVDGPMEVSDDEVMEVSDDDVQLVAEPEPARPAIKIPPAPKLPPAPRPAAVVAPPASEPSTLPSSGLFDPPPPRRIAEPIVAAPVAVEAPRIPTPPPPPAPIAVEPPRIPTPPPPPAPIAVEPPRIPTPPPPPAPIAVEPPRIPTPPPPPAPIAVEPPRIPTPPPPAPIAVEPPRIPTPPPAPIAVEPPRIPTPPPPPEPIAVEAPRLPTPPPPPAPVAVEPAPVLPAPEVPPDEVFVVRGTGSASAGEAPGRPIPLTQVAQLSELDPSVQAAADLFGALPRQDEPRVQFSPDLMGSTPSAEGESSVHISPELFEAPAPAVPEPFVQFSPDLMGKTPSAEGESSVQISPELFDEPAPVTAVPGPPVLLESALFGTPAPAPVDDFFAAPPAAAVPEPIEPEPSPAPVSSGFAEAAALPPPPPPPSIPDPYEADTSDLDDIPVDDLDEPVPGPMPSAPLPITVDEAEFRAAALPPPPSLEEEEEAPVLQGTLEISDEVPGVYTGVATATPDPSAPEQRLSIDEEPLPLEASLDLSGSSNDKIELAGTAEFVTGQFGGEHPAMEVSDNFSDDGEMVLENAPAAVLANPGVDFSGGSVAPDDDAPIPLANNADFLDNAELASTGEKWERTAQGMPLNDWDDETVRRKPIAEQPPALAPAAPEEEELVMGEIVEDDEPLPPPAPAPVRPSAPLGLSPPAFVASPAAPSMVALPGASVPRAPGVVAAGPLVPAPVVRPAANVKPLAGKIPANRYPSANLTAGANAAAAAMAPQAATGPLPNIPVVLQGEHRVIVHTIEGQVKRGALRNQDLGGSTINLHGTVNEQIPLARVKAIFFMLPPGAQPPPPEGRKVRVTFRDGRQVAGFSNDHDRAALGLFVVPTDNRTNTARIFVYRHAVQSVGVD